MKHRKDNFRRCRRLQLEGLEPRIVLNAGPLVISELMANNDTTLADQDGDFPDWIEIHNPTDATQSLDGWHLTDDDDDPDKWRFPEVDVAPGGYRVVFASGKNRTDPADELHTDFQLDSDGEYLALVRPDGVTVHQEFAPEFPAQDDDFSYGLFQNTLTLISGDEPIRYRVPTADDDPTAWTLPAFDDAAWPPKRQGTDDPDYRGRNRRARLYRDPKRLRSRGRHERLAGGAEPGNHRRHQRGQRHALGTARLDGPG